MAQEWNLLLEKAALFQFNPEVLLCKTMEDFAKVLLVLSEIMTEYEYVIDVGGGESLASYQDFAN